MYMYWPCSASGLTHSLLWKTSRDILALLKVVIVSVDEQTFNIV